MVAEVISTERNHLDFFEVILYGFYHGKSQFFPTLWENIVQLLFQTSWPSKSQMLIFQNPPDTLRGGPLLLIDGVMMKTNTVIYHLAQFSVIVQSFHSFKMIFHGFCHGKSPFNNHSGKYLSFFQPP